VHSGDAIPPRREFKYLVPRSELPALRQALRPWCDPDPHAGDDGVYALRSLYFDTPDLRLFHANESEMAVRFKARVRCYPEAARGPIIAEVKFRDGDIIRKTRTRLPHNWQNALRAGSGMALDPFVVRMHRYDLRPVLLVDYRREAWMSRIDEYARVSIDTKIECQSMTRLNLQADPKRWRSIDHPQLTFTERSPCVVELKWAEAAPSWMVLLTQRLDMIRHSFSKYCNSMLSLAEDSYRDYREAQSVWV